MSKIEEMKIDYNLHTHTYRCGHAKGTDEEFVLKAISMGFKTLGFADHMFLPNLPLPGFRGDYEEIDGYISSINSLKEKYKDQINIYLGLECEYTKRFENYYKKLLNEKKFDYLIQGQHFNFDNEDYPTYIRDIPYNDQKIWNYVEHIKQGIDSGFFLYVAHPDLYVTCFEKWNDVAEKAAREICEYAAKKDMPLEMNIHPINHWYDVHYLLYPCEEFWKIAGEYNCKVVIGYDAHRTDDFDDNLEMVFNMIEKYKLNHVDITKTIIKK